MLAIVGVTGVSLAIVAVVAGPSLVGPSSSPGRDPVAPPATLAPPAADPEAWRSVVWRRSGPLDDNAGATSITAVALGERGILLVGHADRVLDPGLDPPPAVAWHSIDGRAWRRSDLGAEGTPTAVAAGAGGYVVAVSEGHEQLGTQLLTSPDGVTWQRRTRPEQLAGTLIVSIAAGPGGYLALGSGRADGEPGLWRSADGTSWVEVDPRAAQLERGVPVDIVHVNGRWMLVGMDGAGPGAQGIVWTSDDGVTWAAGAAVIQAPPGDARLRSVTPFAGGLFADGSFVAADDRDRCQEASAGAVGGSSVTVGLICDPSLPAWFTSVDGSRWQLAGSWPREEDPDPRLDLIHPAAVSAGGPGLVALAYEAADAGIENPGLWVSRDGVTWSRVDGDRPVGAHDLPVLAVRGRLVIAAAAMYREGRSRPTVWLGEVSALPLAPEPSREPGPTRDTDG